VTRSKRLVLALGCCGVVSLLVSTLWVTEGRREPVYNGVTVTEWLRRLFDGGGLPETRQAVQAIGTNAVPYFLEGVTFQRSSWKSNALERLNGFPKRLQPGFLVDWLAESRNTSKFRYAGILAWLLEEKALPAAPELLKASYDPRGSIHLRALDALAVMGTHGYPFLLQAARDQHHPYRRDAIQRIAHVFHYAQTRSDICQDLIGLTSDPDPQCKKLAGIVLLYWLTAQTYGDLQEIRQHPIVQTNQVMATLLSGYANDESLPRWSH
jgi:hypothetical protein